MPKTDFLELEITTDNETKFEQWRNAINGPDNSNAKKIDTFAENIHERVEESFGVGGTLLLPVLEWIGNTMTFVFSDLKENDGVFFGPASLADKENSEIAGLFLSSSEGTIQFVCLDTPTVDIELSYFIVRGKEE